MGTKRIFRFAVPSYTIRVWKREDGDKYEPQFGYSEIELAAHANQNLSMRELATLLMQFDGVCAVECLDWSLNGILLEE